MTDELLGKILVVLLVHLSLYSLDLGYRWMRGR